MKKLQMILAGLLVCGASAVMAQDPSTQEPKKSDQYSTEQTTPADSTIQQEPSDNMTTPPAQESPADGSSSTPAPSDTTVTTPPTKKEIGTEEEPATK